MRKIFAGYNPVKDNKFVPLIKRLQIVSLIIAVQVLYFH